MTDFDVIILIQSLEFRKSQNFRSNLKKKLPKNQKKSFFHLKIDFYEQKNKI